MYLYERGLSFANATDEQKQKSKEYNKQRTDKYIKEKIEEKSIYDFTQSAFNHKEAMDIINSMALTDSSAEEKAMIFNKKVYDTLIINDIALAYHGARKIFFQ